MRLEEQRRPGRVQRTEALPVVGGHIWARVRHETRVVGVGHRVDVGGIEAGFGQAPGRGLLRQLPGGEGHRTLPVLAPADALLFGGGDDLAVDHHGRDRIMETALSPRTRA